MDENSETKYEQYILKGNGRIINQKVFISIK